jgi:nitrate/nitrite transporter NarK
MATIVYRDSGPPTVVMNLPLGTRSSWGLPHTLALLAACLSGAVRGSNLTDHAPLIPILTASLDFSAAEATYIAAAVFVTLAIGQVLGGPLCDRFGTKASGAWSMTIAAVGTAGVSQANGLEALIVLKVVIGLAAGISATAAMRLAGTYFDEQHRHLTMGLHGGSVVLGSGLSIALMPRLAAMTEWRTAFVLAAVFAVAVVVLWIVSPGAPGGRSASPFGAVGVRAVWLLGVINLTTVALGLVLGGWITIYFVEDLGLRLVDAAAIGSIMLVLGIVVRPIGGVLVRRGIMRANAAILISVLITLGGVLLLALPGRPLVVAALGMLLLGIGTNLPFSAIYVSGAAVHPSAPGAALGLIGGLGTLASVPAGAIVGWLYPATGSFVVPFGAVALIVLTGVGAAVALWNRLSPDAPPPLAQSPDVRRMSLSSAEVASR